MNKRGFTLVEIVMVLVLFGILAAVAVPKYFDMKETAEFQTAKGIVAEYQARIDGRFAEEYLSGSNCSLSRTTAIDKVNEDIKFGDLRKSETGYEFVRKPVVTDSGLKVVQLKKGNVTFPELTVSLPICVKEDPFY